MNILHVNYYFHPIVNARSIRWLNFVNYLTSQGHDVDVLTVNASPRFSTYIPGAEKLIPETLKVYRTHPGLLHRIQYDLLSRNSHHPQHTAGGQRKPRRGLLRALLTAHWHRKLREAVLFPDQFIEWLPIGVRRGLKLMRAKKYDCIITSAMPYTDHLVGYFLKRFHKDVFWVAEYGDPWTFCPPYPPRPWLIQKLHQAVERRILRRVDRVIATTEETRQGFLEHFPFLRPEQVVTIPQGTDTELIDALPTRERTRFTVGYIGKFDFIRDPRPLFESLKILEDEHCDFEFVMAGLLQNFYQKAVREVGLGDHAVFMGKQPHREALEIAKSCHALLYWGNLSTYQLPSKLWEYLALRKPILCVTCIDGDIGAELVRKYRRGVVLGCQPEPIAAAIRRMAALWKEGRLESEFDLSPIEEVDWRHRAAQLNAMLASAGV
jgi:glycosyltransferase involved in cell wall biosynthesis